MICTRFHLSSKILEYRIKISGRGSAKRLQNKVQGHVRMPDYT